MARKATQTNTATKGCLDPDLSERIDLKHFYDSLQDGLNQEVRPQGGWARRAGTRLNSDPDVLAAGLKRRMRRRITPVDLTAPMVTLHNGGTAANLVDQDVNTLFTTTAVTGSAFVIVEFDLGVSLPIVFVDLIGFFCETAAKNNALAVEYYDGSAWVEVQGAIDAGLSPRRHLRVRGSQAPTTIDLASTQHFELKDLPIVDGVQTIAGMKVLMKDHADPVKNGLYLVPASGDWTRATIANTASKILKAAYFVSDGVSNAGTTWVNNQVSLNDLNSIGKKSTISYQFVPIAGRTRRFGEWPGGRGGVPVSARNWRIVAKDAAGAGAVSISGVRFWQERRELSPQSKPISFDRGSDAIYSMVLTERNVDVFKRSSTGSRRYVASIPVPIAAHQVDSVTAIQSRDTMMLFHEDVPTVRIVRQGSDTEWNAATIPSYNVPALPPGTAFSGDQDEIQDVTFAGFANGDKFVIWVGDVVTPAMTYAGLAGLDSAIAAAIGALPGLSAPTVTQIDSVPTMRIAFTGASGSRAWPAIQIMPLGTSAATPGHAIVQPGLIASGPWFGPKTGWARCGFFVQGRVLVGGFRAAPFSWGVSKIDSYDFKSDPGPAEDDDSTAPPLTADMAFFRTLDTDQVETIQQVFIGRNLQFFTDSSEWYVDSRTLDATQPANAVRATGSGIKESVRAVFSEGSTIIVQQGGRTVRDFLFNDVEQSYKAEALSLLGPHLLTDVVDVAQRKALSTQEANLIYFVNADGSLVTLSLLRSQDVIGMMPATTDGRYRGVIGHFNGDVEYIIRRETVSGGADLYLEQRDDTTVLDAAITVTSTEPFTTVTGLEHHEGKEVWAYAGSELCGPFVVTGGTIEVLDDDAATTITVGLFPPLYGKGQKLREKMQNDQPFRPPARIYELGLSLKNTGQLQIRVNGGDWIEVPLTYMDGGTLDYGELADPPHPAGYSPELPMLDRLLTGDVTLENLWGWSKHPVIEWRQTVPAPLHIKAIRAEYAMKG